jgi:small-conductance mechanosensitive channel
MARVFAARRNSRANALHPARALTLVIVALALVIAGAAPKKSLKKKGLTDAGASASVALAMDSSSAIADAGASAAPPAMSSAPVASASASAPPAPSSAPAASAPAPSARPAPSGSTDNEVRLHDVPVFVIRVPHGPQTAPERARAASEALETAAKDVDPTKVRVEQLGGVAIVYADKIPIVQLYPEDAAASGDASLEVHANDITTRVQRAITDEQKRSAIAKTVLSICLVIFGALITLYFLRLIRDFSRRLRGWYETNPERFSALRLRTFEVVGAAALRGAVGFALSVGKWVAQIGVVYVYLLLVFSLFASTRGYSERLTGFVFTPLSQLTSRVASSVPVLVVLLVLTVAVVVTVRFVRLFFAAIAHGETHVDWMPADLAEPSGVLLRVGIVLGAVVFAAPVVTGETEGALARFGTIALVAIAVASVPMLASVLVATSVIYLRRLRPGEYAEFGGRTGKVTDIGLLEVRLEDADGCEVRVPQLLGLIHPTRMLGATPRVSVDIAVTPTAPLDQVQAILLQAASAQGGWAKVELTGIDADGAHHRLSIGSAAANARTELLSGAAKALAAARIALGRSRPRTP